MSEEDATTNDPLLLDADGLHAIAAEAVVRAGLSDVRENRVVALRRDAEALWAEIEDADEGVVISVSITVDTAGRIIATGCRCADATGDGGHCRHAVAALYAYTAEQLGNPDLRGALEAALEERRQRGRSEVRVTKLDGEPWFGTWEARSLSTESHFPQSYTVHIRSLSRRANYCTCPDFSVNQLGTCKHIEAALHRIAKRPDFPHLQGQAAPIPYLYLDWEAENAPRIRLHRSGVVPEDLADELDHHFDAQGLFRGRLPEDFFPLADRLDGRADIHLGADAVDHARHLASVAGRRSRVEAIQERITAAGGQLPGVRARLYPYQAEGVAFLAGNERALLADDMGLGKTLQAISAAVWLHCNDDAERIAVVCPASLKHQWAREIERFTDLEAHVIQGPAAARHHQYRQGPGFYILNYELVLRDLSELTQAVSPDLLILDEAQRIKNWRTKIAAAVKRIPSRYAFVLSGTPLENRLEDLYSLMQVVDQRALGPLWRYLADFHVTDESGKVLGYRNLSELRRRLRPVMLRRDRRLVRDQLPERIEQRIDVPMTDAQRELHDSALANAGYLATIARRRPLTPVERNRLMAALQQARMACDCAGLVDKESAESPKLDELATLLDELCLQGGQKAVVFSQWERMTALAEQRLRAIGLGCVRLHGGVPTAKRGELMERFNSDDALRVFISTDAGGSGLNLQCASVMVNLDVPWNPAVLEQRIARVHRLGQRRRVQSVIMVAADSYEEHVLSLVHTKRDLFDNVVDPEADGEVVGVSRKLIEVLAEDVGEMPQARAGGATVDDIAAGDAAGDEAAVAATDEEENGAAAGGDDPIEDILRRTIERIQDAFGPRVERILGAGGGLLVVLDPFDDTADETAQRLSEAVPVAVIDPRSLASVQRLGAASPLGETRTLYQAGAQPAVASAPARRH